jgi:hypothetical protein
MTQVRVGVDSKGLGGCVGGYRHQGLGEGQDSSWAGAQRRHVDLGDAGWGAEGHNPLDSVSSVCGRSQKIGRVGRDLRWGLWNTAF